MKKAHIIIVLVLAAIIIYLAIPHRIFPGFTGITTTDGQFFVGRAYKAPLSRFIELRDPFLLGGTTATAETPTVTPKLIDLTLESYWQPKSIYLNVKNITIKGAVGQGSQIAITINQYIQKRAAATTPAPEPANATTSAPAPAKTQ